MSDIYSLTFRDTVGATTLLAGFRGKVLLLVNTATKCGLAPQFEELEALYQRYKDQGLVVIGFPCDQFASQEPETNDTLVSVCKRDFGVTFLLSEKIMVNGPHTHPVFRYLKDHSNATLGKEIKWNFTKFLVARDGKKIRRFAPTTSPASLVGDIETLLVL